MVLGQQIFVFRGHPGRGALVNTPGSALESRGLHPYVVKPRTLHQLRSAMPLIRLVADCLILALCQVTGLSLLWRKTMPSGPSALLHTPCPALHKKLAGIPRNRVKRRKVDDSDGSIDKLDIAFFRHGPLNN